MIKNNVRIQAQNKPFNTGIEILISEGPCVGRLQFEEIPDGVYEEPTAVIDNTAAQELMDALWYCGIRPSEGSGSTGSLRATEKHLEDMRKIAFSQLFVDGVVVTDK